ncbi:MAG: hypothetical protein WCA04_13885 [Geobacteraceae bacterium]
MRRTFSSLFIIVLIAASFLFVQEALSAGDSGQAEIWKKAIQELQRKVKVNDQALAMIDAKISEKMRQLDEARKQNRDARDLVVEIGTLQQQRSLLLDVGKHWKAELQSVSQ